MTFHSIELVLNETVLELFEQHRSEFLEDPLLCLVPAVWGVKTEGELTATQRKIHRKLAPMFDAFQERFPQGTVDANGVSLNDYLLRGLTLYKMAYIAQYYLNCVSRGKTVPSEDGPLLEGMEPVGRA